MLEIRRFRDGLLGEAMRQSRVLKEEEGSDEVYVA